MTKPRLPLLLMTALLLAGLASPAEAAAPPKEPSPRVGPPAGSISALLPVARIVRGAGRAAVSNEARKGDAVIWNDLIKTERGGRARITLADQSILSLGSQAELKILKHDARTQQTALQLAGGRLRAEVTRIARLGGRFELRTPTAVAGVIGTDFGTDASTVGVTTFVCISGEVQVANADPAVAGSVQCAAGMTTSVSAGQPPTPPVNATPEQIQALILDTEPALISAMSVVSAAPGATVNAAIIGTKLAGVKVATASGSGVTLSLTGVPTETSVSVQVVVASDAAPGPRTITLTKESGAASAVVFTVLVPLNATATGDPKKAYQDQFEQERVLTRAGLGAYLLRVQQAIDLANQQLQQGNTGNVDLTQAAAALAAELKNAQNAVDSAGTAVDNAVTSAVASFDQRFSTPEAAAALFQEVNSALGVQFNTIRLNLNGALQPPLTSIAQVQTAWMSTISAAAKQPPTPAVNSIERNLDLGAALGSGSIAAFDASNSKAAGGATILGYKWVLCGKEYKPAQFGVPIAATAGGCSPIPGYTSNSAEFSFATCSLEAADYVARLTITDSNNLSAAMDVKVHVLPGAYDDPAHRFINLAAAYSTLQTQQYLAFFDESQFAGYTDLSENVRKTFPTLATMNINAIVTQATSQCNDATVRGNWDQNYTYKTSPNLNLNQKEQLEMRLVRTPGKGWFITYFLGDNGTVPGIANVDTGAPDLTLAAVYPTYAGQPATSAVPVPPGSQSFTAVVKNEGTADLSANTVVRFTLSSPSGTFTVDEPLPVPLKTGASVNVAGLLSVPPSVGAAFQVTAVVNPNQNVSEPNYGNNSGAAALFVGTPVKLGQLSPALSFVPGGPSQTLQVSVSDPASVSILLPAGITTTSPNPQVFTAAGTATWILSADFNARQGAGLTTKVAALASGITVDLPIPYSVAAVVFTQVNPVALTSGLGGTLAMSVNVPGTFALSLPAGITTSSPNPQPLTSAGTLSWNLGADYTAAVGTFTGGAGGTSTMLVTALNGTVPSATKSAAAYSVAGVTFSQPNPPTMTAGKPTPVSLALNVNAPGPFVLTLPAGLSTAASKTQTATSVTGGYQLTWPIEADLTLAAGTYTDITVAAGQFTFSASYTVAGPAIALSPVNLALTAGDILNPQTLTANVSVPGTYTLSLPPGITTTAPLTQSVTVAPNILQWPLTASFDAARGVFTTNSTMKVSVGVYSTPASYSVASPTFSQTSTPALVPGDVAKTLQVGVSVPGTYTLLAPTGITASPAQVTITSPGTLTWSLQAGFSAALGSGAATVAAMTSTGPSTSYTFAAGFDVAAPAFAQVSPSNLSIGGGPQPLTISLNNMDSASGAQFRLTLPPGITADANPQTFVGGSVQPIVNWYLSADLTAVAGTSLPITVTLMNGSTPSQFTYTASYSLVGPIITQTVGPGLLAGGAPGALVVTVNLPGSYQLALPPGISSTSPNPQVAAGTAGPFTLTWNLSADLTANPGAAQTTVTAMNGATPSAYLAHVNYAVVGPTLAPSATANLIAGGPAQAISLASNIPGTFLLTLPPGITTADPNPQTVAAAGIVGWNISAGLSATTGTTLSTVATAMAGSTPSQYATQVNYSVAAPTFVLTASPNLASGGAAQALSVAVNIPGTFKLNLPAGVTTADPNPQVAAGTGPPYVLTWNIQADVTAGTGALNATVVAMDGAAESAYTFAAAFSIAGQANYVLSNVAFAGHTGTFTGADALQTDEQITITGKILNTGNASPVGTIDVATACVGTGCGTPNTVSGLAAPAAGDPNGTPFTITFTNGLAPGSYSGNVTLSTSLPQSSTADDAWITAFEDVDFTLSVNQAFTGTQNILIGGSGQVPIGVTLQGTATPFAIPVTVSGTYTGVSYSPASANVNPGTNTSFNILTTGSTPSGSLNVTFTGTNHGVTKTVNFPAREVVQPVLFVSEQLAPTNLFLNGQTDPLKIQMGTVITNTPQVVALKMSGDTFAGQADVKPPAQTLGFVSQSAATTIPAGGTFDWQLTATTTAATTPPTKLTMVTTLPNSNPPADVTYDLWVIGVGLPDLTVTGATHSITTANPWIDGQGVDFDVTIQNHGQSASAGGEEVSVVVGSVIAGSTTVGTLAPGQTTTVRVHAVAPDAHGTANFFGTANVKVHVDPDAIGDMFYADNTLTMLAVPMANWHVAVSGAGTQSLPLPMTLATAGSTTVRASFASSVDGGASIANYSTALFNSVGQTSTSFSIANFQGTAGSFTADITTASNSAQSGLYFAQVIMQMKDGPNITAQRQATVWMNVTNTLQAGGVTVTPTLTSSRNNCQGAGCVDALGNTVAAGTPIQINGGLAEQFTVTLGLTCTIVGAGSQPCPGSADLAFHDAPNTNTPASTLNAATGSAVPVTVKAAEDPNGNLNAGPATGYLVGISGVQHQVKRGEVTTAPDAVGAQVQFLFNVGDLDINVISGLDSNVCIGVPANAPTASQISAAWNPLGGFNVSNVVWEIQGPNNNLPAGSSPISFSSVAGVANCSSGTSCTALPTFTLTNVVPQDGLLTYAVAATISNGTTTATKYFPFFVDASLTQNFCGAVSSVRGAGVRIHGSWSRSAAGFGGPVTMLARPAVKPASAAGTPDVRVSDVSYTPSLPKAGDTVQVRFRLRNEGDSNATAMPVALQINGLTVVSDTFDVPAGRAVLGGLQWTAEGLTRAAARRRPRGKVMEADLREPDDTPAAPVVVRSARIVIDPQHTQTQKSALEKSAALAHFGLRSASTAAAANLASVQRLLIELGEGACVGLRPASGAVAPCGNAEVELTAEDLSKTLLMLNATSGVADMGAAFGPAQAVRTGATRFSPQMPALAGHTYAVQLSDGRTAQITFESVRNPRELDAKARATFRRHAAARVLKQLGTDSGPADPGDLTGNLSTPTVFITITVQAP